MEASSTPNWCAKAMLWGGVVHGSGERTDREAALDKGNGKTGDVLEIVAVHKRLGMTLCGSEER
jgi:hypothetical protein